MSDTTETTPTPTDHLPIVDEESRPFWDALGEGTFLLKWCTECGQPHFFPRVYCPYCWGETEWRPASGRGEVFATTTVRHIGVSPFRERLPYDVSIVQLAEGPLMLTTVTGVPSEDVKIGMAVELAPFRDGPMWLPWFRVAGAG